MPRSIVERWQQIWYPETSGVRLAICRIVVISSHVGVTAFFRPGLSLHLNLLRNDESYTTPRLITQLCSWVLGEQVIRSPGFMVAVYIGMYVAGVLAVIGWRTRLFCLIYASCNAFLISHYYSYGELHHTESLMAIFLFLLPFSDCGRRFSVDSYLTSRRLRQQAMHSTKYEFWILYLTQSLVALSYLDAGLSKLYTGGLQWFNGYTMQYYVIHDAIRMDSPLGIWVAQSFWLCVALSYVAVVFEITFVVAIFVRRLIPYYFFIGIAFHLGIYLVQGADFFETMILYAVFVPFERLWPQPTSRS